MQIQSGRFYKTREGNKVGPAVRADSASYPWVVGLESYTDSGAYYSFIDAPHHLDLVAECVEAAAKFKVGDRVRMVREVTGRTTDIPATVREFYVGSHQPYLIEFDTDPGFGHRGSFGVRLSDDNGWHVEAADIELIAAKFKAGDRVRSVSDDADDIDIGDEFTITEIDDAEYINFIDKGGDERYRRAERYALVTAPAFKIEVGKSYTDADGKVIGPMFACGECFAAIVGNGQSWRADGTVNGSDGDPRPLVAEYVAAPPLARPVFKVGDRVKIQTSDYSGPEANDNEGVVTAYPVFRRRGDIEVAPDGYGGTLSYTADELTLIAGPTPTPAPAIGDWVAITAERYTAPDAEVGRLGQVRGIAGGMYNVRVSETGLSYAFAADEIKPAEKPAFVYKAACKETTDDARSAILGAIEEFGERAWNDNLLPAEFQPPAVARLMRAAGL